MRPRRRERLSDAIAGRILYEDRDLVVVDKPAGMLTTHTRLEGRAAREAQLTAENCLNDYLRKGQTRSRLRVWLVHRLDRETSGVMMFAKSEEVDVGSVQYQYLHDRLLYHIHTPVCNAHGRSTAVLGLLLEDYRRAAPGPARVAYRVAWREV